MILKFDKVVVVIIAEFVIKIQSQINFLGCNGYITSKHITSVNISSVVEDSLKLC